MIEQNVVFLWSPTIEYIFNFRCVAHLYLLFHNELNDERIATQQPMPEVIQLVQKNI